MWKEVELEDNMLYCPYCGTRVLDYDEGDFKNCPHVVFAYAWCSGDPDAFMCVRRDYAAKFVEKLKASEDYAEYSAGYDDDEEPFDNEITERFVSSNFESGDEVSECFALFGNYYLEVCSEDTILFCRDYPHSGVHIAIDQGSED